MRHWLTAMTIVTAMALGAPPAAAQPADETLRRLQRDVEALREGQQRLQKDVQEIKDLLRARGGAAAPAEPPANLALGLAGRIVKGAPAAKVVLVDFTDYQ
jgi:hypothetical protein